MCGGAALAVWKLSQYPYESCNSGHVVAVLAGLHVSALFRPKRIKVCLVMTRLDLGFNTLTVNTRCASILYSTLLANGYVLLEHLFMHFLVTVRFANPLLLANNIQEVFFTI